MRQVETTPSCDRCRGAGWIVETSQEAEVVVPCPECHTRARRRRLLANAGIPARYENKGFEEYQAMHPRQNQALAASRRFVEEYPGIDRGLLLVGPCGVGKTHLTVAILKQLIRNMLVPGRFVDEAELLRRLQYSYSAGAPETERDVLIPLMEVELLVWDDLGTGRPTEWVAETIRTVINHRYTNNKITLFSTNWPLSADRPSAGKLDQRIQEKTLAERIGKRLLSRIQEMCRTIEIEGVDFRTEISKPGRDTLARRRERFRTTENPGSLDVRALLECQSCGSKKEVRVLEQREKEERDGIRSLDVSAMCQACDSQIIANFKDGRLEYL